MGWQAGDWLALVRSVDLLLYLAVTAFTLAVLYLGWWLFWSWRDRLWLRSRGFGCQPQTGRAKRGRAGLAGRS